MSRKEVPRAGLVKAALAGKITNQEGAQALRLSVRQFKRLKARFRREGTRGLVHRRRGQPSRRRSASALRDQIGAADDHDLCRLQRRAPHGEAAAGPRPARKPGDRAPDSSGARARLAHAAAARPRIAAGGPGRRRWGNSCSWMPAPSPGSKTAARWPPCTASSTTPPQSRWRCGSAPPKSCTATPPCWARPAGSTACR